MHESSKCHTTAHIITSFSIFIGSSVLIPFVPARYFFTAPVDYQLDFTYLNRSRPSETLENNFWSVCLLLLVIYTLKKKYSYPPF